MFGVVARGTASGAMGVWRALGAWSEPFWLVCRSSHSTSKKAREIFSFCPTEFKARLFSEMRCRELPPSHFYLSPGLCMGASDWSYAIVPVLGPLVGGGLAGMLLRAIGKERRNGDVWGKLAWKKESEKMI